ncbi:MAG: erythromycin biosynthesis sensory transduction protein eryC1 [Parcubacteria group bacterium]|nr:MAG: erythromycin biosynthesis sensory transduction protein eryC1 [Parcubacteria group bacterium]
MKVPFVDLRAQYLKIKPEIDAAIQAVIDNTAFVSGKYVESFEKNFAEYNGVKYAIGVESGTAALYLALLAAGIKAGDEVITVPNTFIATASSIALLGAIPVFVDIDEQTNNIDVSKIEAKITPKTKAIIPVHLYGQTADMDPIMSLAEKNHLLVIEDACQAHGAKYKGKKAGSIGLLGCFSFYPGKNLGAYGEGGAVITNDGVLADKLYKLRDHGSIKKYHHEMIGGNFRMDGIQGAVLDVKLKYLDSWNDLRRGHAQCYSDLLKNVQEVILPGEPEYSRGNYHLYIIRTKKRDELQQYLQTKDIATGIHYPIPIHLQPAFAHLNLPAGSYPVAEKVVPEILSLPMYAELTEEQCTYVAGAIADFFSHKD